MGIIGICRGCGDYRAQASLGGNRSVNRMPRPFARSAFRCVALRWASVTRGCDTYCTMTLQSSAT
ncbi:hypothetical protein L2216_21365, partial [Xanthomonas perforans]|nr:hypothetical protein [Xanthomonas perforans]